ncbi:MAG TPA: nuclear transport factor 2 family protein [Deltaproteobacteria bacterium]|nr:nuclear transport factor 2 family protein [Candidatus Binatota bacterium]HIL13755.1 nuclear transport factor 2 family protein [Deltaproteobacteria bacterium]
MNGKEISDRIDIQDLLVRYCTAIDTQNWELLDTCFVADARVDYSASGGTAGDYPEVRAWLAKALAPFKTMMHFIGNSSVTLDGNSASARTYVINPMGMDDGKGGVSFFTVGAIYDDDLVRVEAGWRISRRDEELVYMEGAVPSGLEVSS